MFSQRESVTVLEECIELQKRKSQDYQNPNSNIVQAMHYRRGISTIHDMISQKLLRAQSLIEPAENWAAIEPNFESLEDTYKDLINYASFAVSYIRGRMEGQSADRDMFNRRQEVIQDEPTVQEVDIDPEPQIPVPLHVKLAEAYVKNVQPAGPIVVPPGEEVITDNVIKTYKQEVLDIGDRLDEEIEAVCADIADRADTILRSSYYYDTERNR